MIHYACYLFVLWFTERNITQRDAIKAWLVFDTVCVVENEYSLSVPLCISDERSHCWYTGKKKRKKKKFVLIVQCAEWQETAVKWTHFICLTIVLFPDSPAPGKDRGEERFIRESKYFKMLMLPGTSQMFFSYLILTLMSTSSLPLSAYFLKST